jgi:hypothetical protein
VSQQMQQPSEEVMREVKELILVAAKHQLGVFVVFVQAVPEGVRGQFVTRDGFPTDALTCAAGTMAAALQQRLDAEQAKAGGG